MFHRSLFSVFCFAVLLGLAGCGKEAPALNTIPVAGTVTHNGQPVDGAAVSFFPADPNSGKPAIGTTDSAGKFTLQTMVGGTKMAQGALAGDYKVTVIKETNASSSIMDPVADPKSLTKEQMEAMKKKQGFKDPNIDPSDTAKIEEMKKGNSGAFNPAGGIQTEGKGSSLPAKYADVKSTDLKATVKKGDKNDFPFDLKDG